MPDSIYQRPADYDLEHEHDAEDVAFYCRLAARLGPARVLELGCGSGRVTVPLAREAVRRGFDVVGLDESEEMLTHAAGKLRELGPDAQGRAHLVRADMREYVADRAFDLIVVPCSTLSHVLDLDDQVRVWRNAYANLRPGGRFVVDLSMPNLRAYADSLQSPPRAIVEMDMDNEDGDGRRLIRYKTTVYEAHLQRARVHFLYDRFEEEKAERHVSDFESHVYYPRELELLFRLTGFAIDAVYGDYRARALGPASRDIIMIGRRPA